MKAKVLKRTTCRLCESSNVEMAVKLEPIPLTEKYLTQDQLNDETHLYDIDLFMCLDCGHVQIFDIIDPLVLWDNFTFRSGQAQIIIDHLNDVAKDTINTFKIPEGSLVVDVGSNDGTLLRGFKNQGMNVLGIDPATTIAKEAIASGIPTLINFFNYDLSLKIKAENGPAKIVCCFNAFAHADNLNELAKGIQNLLSEDGIFVFEVEYLVDIVDDIVLGAIIHEHLSHHSVKPMASFLNKNGMELIDVKRNPFQGGSFIGIAQKIGGPRVINKCVDELIKFEEDNGFTQPSKIKSLGDRLIVLKNQLGELIKEWKSQHYEIAGYGAARSGPTLTAQLHLGDKIDFIVDNHPQKVNKFTPGDRIPVLPTVKLLERLPKYTIILAWVHAKKIIRDNLEYLNQGGNFVLVCPEVKIINSQNYTSFI